MIRPKNTPRLAKMNRIADSLDAVSIAMMPVTASAAVIQPYTRTRYSRSDAASVPTTRALICDSILPPLNGRDRQHELVVAVVDHLQRLFALRIGHQRAQRFDPRLFDHEVGMHALMLL